MHMTLSAADIVVNELEGDDFELKTWDCAQSRTS